MAFEFERHNDLTTVERFRQHLPRLILEPHIEFKKRVTAAIGLVRSAGTAQYSNVILQSA